MLEAKKITKRMDKREILKDISLSLEGGDIVSIIGPSGAGKTSLLRALALIELSDSGSLEIDGETYTFPIKELEEIRYPYPSLTVVFQQLFIWPHLTIRGNLTLPLKSGVDKDHFEEVVNLFEMSTFLDRYPNEVSLGQRQRAALARALLLRPKYLLLDEVTSALDVEQSHLILGHLKQIATTGVGIIFVTHALHLASKISNKVVFLDNGTIIEQGTADILNKPGSERLQKFIEAAKQVV